MPVIKCTSYAFLSFGLSVCRVQSLVIKYSIKLMKGYKVSNFVCSQNMFFVIWASTSSVILSHHVENCGEIAAFKRCWCLVRLYYSLYIWDAGGDFRQTSESKRHCFNQCCYRTTEAYRSSAAPYHNYSSQHEHLFRFLNIHIELWSPALLSGHLEPI